MNSPVSVWSTHFKNTKHYPPAPLLEAALPFVQEKRKAIDIGGGATLKDSIFLISQGFETTVVDKEAEVALAVEALGNSKLHCYISEFKNFTFPKNEFDLAAAIYSLPFNGPIDFQTFFSNLRNSIVHGGVFCGHFFGLHDDWNNNPAIAFHSKEQVLELLAGMEIILFEEKEFDGKTADGKPKHRHVFDVIARKL